MCLFQFATCWWREITFSTNFYTQAFIDFFNRHTSVDLREKLGALPATSCADERRVNLLHSIPAMYFRSSNPEPNYVTEK